MWISKFGLARNGSEREECGLMQKDRGPFILVLENNAFFLKQQSESLQEKDPFFDSNLMHYPFFLKNTLL